MLISGRPLLDSAADAALLVGRASEIDRLEQATSAGLNVVVVGERGVGATSVVHALGRRFPTSKGPGTVFVRGGGARSVLDVLGRVVTALGYAGPDTMPSVEVLLRQLQVAVDSYLPEPVVLVVDDLPVAVGIQLLAQHRDALWVLGAAWVVTVSVEDSVALLAAPGGSFFEVRLDLAPLSRTDVAALLAARGGEVAALDAQQVWEAAGGGHPRRVLDVVRAVISGGVEVTGAHTAHTVAVGELTRPAQSLFAELGVLGAASASDPDLQQRTGWSRVRLQQVLTQLENTGLVRSSLTRPAGGQGRARKVFHPVAPVDWFTQQAAVAS